MSWTYGPFLLIVLYIFPGVNTPDHSVLYTNIVEQVKRKVTPYVALLQCKSKATTLKHVMQSIASQLVDNSGGEGATNLLSTQHTLSNIERWYCSMESRPPSTPKVSLSL